MLLIEKQLLNSQFVWAMSIFYVSTNSNDDGDDDNDNDNHHSHNDDDDNGDFYSLLLRRELSISTRHAPVAKA